MKYFGLFASCLTLVLLGAAPPPNAKSLQASFPDIKFNASVLEPRGEDGKPLLKIIRTDYLEDQKIIVWLLELQTDIGFDELRIIDMKWYSIGSTMGPGAYVFDKEHVALYLRDMKLLGKLYEGKKGDCVRMLLDASKGFPDAVYLDVRRR